MNQSTVAGLLLFLLLIAGLATLNGALLLLALPLLLYIAAGSLVGPDQPRLEVTRMLDVARLPAETPATVTVTIHNKGAAIDELHLRDELPAGLRLLEGEHEWLMPLAAGETRTLRYVVAGPRGAYHFAGLQATARDAFSLRPRAIHFPAGDHLLYFLAPRPNALKEIEIRPRRTRVYAGTVAAHAGGEGTDFFGVRPYQRGDSLRRINWKAAARHRGALFTNEFEQERVADVGLILDVRQASNLPYGEQSLLDYGVEAATLLADVFLKTGDRVALLMYGATLDYTLPGYGKVQRNKLLRALGRARLGERRVFQELKALPTSLFPPQSQIVFISPLLPGDLPFLRRLRALGYQVMLVSPNPVVYEAAVLAEAPGVSFAARLARIERERLLGQLCQAGIFVLDWDLERPLDEVAGAAGKQWAVSGKQYSVSSGQY